MTETVTAHEITITRVFDAPRELVWRAWTEPERLARWWGKRGWTAQLSSIEMVFRTTMQTAGENFRQAQGGLSSAFDRLAEQLAREGSR